ncbi:MAG: glycosyltransferase family 9 protein, partial [Candidatus Margulisbacteria bacterium]|nr:glycosyltransferase family 9 protein [Candidatus Margulisiibacteriota bacterium]
AISKPTTNMPMRSKIFRAKIKEILVIRPDAIGDLVLTLPAIQALKDNFPGARLTALIKEYTRPVADASPAIDAVIYDYDLRKYHFDLSVNFFNEFKDTFAAFRAGIPLRLGDSSRLLTAWMNNLRVFRDWKAPLHEIEQNMALLKPLGITGPAGQPRLIPDREALARVDRLFEKFNLNRNGRVIGLHCGSATNLPWPPENFGAVAKFLSENNYQVLLLGSVKEAPATAVIKNIAPAAIDLSGILSLPDLIALISRLNFYLGLNTGPTHIAAAFNVPMVMVNPNPRSPIYRWGPWLTRHLAVCAGKNETEITTARVLTALKEVLAGGGVSGLEESRAHWLGN